MLPIMAVFAVYLILDMIFLGPLGLNIYDVPIRKAVIGILIVSAVVPMLTRKSKETWPIWLMISMIAFLLVWGVAVPQSNGVNLQLSIAEVQPMVALLLIFPFYFLFSEYGPGKFLWLLQISTLTMGMIIVVLFIITNVLGNWGIGYNVRSFYYNLNDSDFGIYIGGLLDGSFRLMLINFIIFPLMVSYYSWDRINIPMAAFFTAASFATGTRAFVGVAGLVLAAATLRKKPTLALPFLLLGSYLVYTLFIRDSSLRILDFESDLTLTSARYVQFFALVDLFKTHPLMGAGFGASAAVIRSYEAPYSYELTYLALLAKLGIVGIMILFGSLTLWAGRLARQGANGLSISMLMTSIVLITATNPYLINLVGMSIIAFLVALGLWWGDEHAQAPVHKAIWRPSHA